MVGLTGRPSADGRTHADMRFDLQKFRGLPVVRLQNVDEAIYSVTMVGYEEWDVEEYDARRHRAGRGLLHGGG